MDDGEARRATPAVALLTLEGELDLAAAPRLRARIQKAATGRALLIDLERVTFVDSAILKELLRARAELGERDMRLVLAAPMPVRRLLDLTRTADMFEQADDVETALTRLTA